MRILYVSHSHPPENRPLENVGGMQQVSIQLLKHLQTNKNLTVKAEILKTPWKGVVKNVAGFLLRELKRIPQLSNEFNADIILYTSLVTAGLAPALKKVLTIPQVSIAHGRDVTLPYQPYQWYVRKILHALDGVICVSEATREACMERGLSPEDATVIGNGCSLDIIQKLPDKKDAIQYFKKAFDVDLSEKFILLSVGRQVRRKGHVWFVREILPRLDSDMFLLLIGDGPENNKLLKLSQKKVVKNRILLLGKQPDKVLHKAYAISDLFVMPNIPVKGDMEGFGIVILEANFAGIPVVASRLEGIKDVIKPGVNGLFGEPNKADSFIKKIQHIKNGKYPAIRETSFSYATSSYSWQAISCKYVDYLKSKIFQLNIK